VDPSSSLDEEGPIPDTSRDEKFARRLFGDLNRDVHGPPDNGKVIFLSDSDEEEEEVREEDATDAEAMPSSAAGIPAATACTTDADEEPKGVQDDNSGNRTPCQEADGGSNNEDEASSP
jgi:hypothetical protein